MDVNLLRAYFMLSKTKTCTLLSVHKNLTVIARDIHVNFVTEVLNIRQGCNPVHDFH